ncbi:MAG TPA: response regulator transcription factor [Candidatus Limnocylindria bacterium]|nr:response regulator transcription factor [Candidatus Limnocylindria bacterium]
MTDPRPARTLIVDDHPLLVEALVALLSRSTALTVVGAAGTVAEAVALARERDAELVLLDQHLPDGAGTDAARLLRDSGRSVAVVLFTADASDETLLAALEVGVAGFISKREPTGRIVGLLERAARGEIVIPAEDLARLVKHQRDREAERRQRERFATALTPRDREVLQHMSQGLDTRAIAEATGMAVNTVRGHVQMIIEKLETHSRLEAVLRAYALGLVRRPSVGHPQV